MGITFYPFEADAPLVIDADAVLSFASACQALKAICRGDSQIIQILGVVEHTQFSQGNLLDIRRKFARTLAQVYFVRLVVFEGFDHSGDCITPRAKRQAYIQTALNSTFS